MRFITEKQNILNGIPAEIVEIKQLDVPLGHISQRTEPGYLLSDGMVLLESEKDDADFYIGGVNMKGMYLRTPARYEPVKNEAGEICAFRCMSEYLHFFSGAEQELIFQYGKNTKDELLKDLTAALPSFRESPEIWHLFCGTMEKARLIPDGKFPRFLADIQAVYQERHKQEIQQPAKEKRGFEK